MPIKEAYKQIGMRPRQGVWITRQRKSCCGMTARALLAGATIFANSYDQRGICATALGLDRYQVMAYEHGFDGVGPYPVDTRHQDYYDQGRADAIEMGLIVEDV
jgi:hypothetical protein